MASLTIRNLDPAVKDRLRVRAAERGRSMEEEARVILRRAMREPCEESDGKSEPPARMAPDRLADALLGIARSWPRGADHGEARSEDHAALYGEDGLPR